jgi:protein-disulfide isomerase
MLKKRFGAWSLAAFAMVLGAALVNTGWLSAQEASFEKVVDEEALVQRIKTEVIQELRGSDFLQQEIDTGIKRYVQQQQEKQARAPDEKARKNVRPVSSERDHILGNPDAEISLIEYSDFECPYCKRFHSTPKRIVEAYGGKVNWVYRHFPLDFHNPLAQKEAEASECAAELGGNDAFWKYTDLIYERTRSNGKGFPIEGLAPLAGEIGLDVKAFQACLDSGRYAKRVKEDMENGVRSGVSGTPGNILLNNKTGKAKFKPGAVPFDALKAEIDRLLKG